MRRSDIDKFIELLTSQIEEGDFQASMLSDKGISKVSYFGLVNTYAKDNSMDRAEAYKLLFNKVTPINQRFLLPPKETLKLQEMY